MRTISQPINGKVANPVSRVHSPTVPISVYRDLAAELQAAQGKVDSLANQNQQLRQENQQLRQEINKTIQSVLHLQNFTESGVKISNSPSKQTYPPRNFTERKDDVGRVKRSDNPKGVVRNERYNSSQFKSPRPRSVKEPVLIEEQEVRYYRSRPKEMTTTNGWFLAIAIFLIVFAAFGAGYLIVRPILGLQNR